MILRIRNFYIIILMILLILISFFSDLAFRLIFISFSFIIMYELIVFTKENDFEPGVLKRRIIYLFTITIISSIVAELAFTNFNLSALIISFVVFISSYFLSSFIVAHNLKKVKEFSDQSEWFLMISLIVFPIFLIKYKRRMENFEI